jgi:hypothetical protein
MYFGFDEIAADVDELVKKAREHLKGKRSCFCSDTEFQVALSQVKSKY